MERALVIGASGGIGQAVEAALHARGVSVDGLSRSRDGLDLTDEASVTRVLGAVDGVYDQIFVASGGLEIDGAGPEKTIRAIRATAMMDQFALNAVGPALVLRDAARLLPRDRRCVFAALSARVGSIGDNRLGGWISYRAAKAALNQVIRTASIELSRTHRDSICVALHPGTVRTGLTQAYARGHETMSAEDAAVNLLSVINELAPAQTGQFFDWAGKPIEW
ncbi:SDR family NAD(P)-dependent oxidoreductase [Ruegeria sp. 2205SS24-7]|uniref:SDR family NAD(P)-dependent oxidoreductase n=1 Tax=Ruegeria discodermiae TaxID=3064389 RepID=UPI002741219F|nr:SDR family NAD(P)-dependent oxidoreductase [Ruegeria sp. 2205SS24-7]MDP5217379.1 SDR family NAD(P)-dependent oxidoreductase [Ruegeria sp. 2205SS24-7]